MQKYLVKSVDGQYVIESDSWSVGVDGLKFYKQHICEPNKKLMEMVVCEELATPITKETVAWFTTWDYWMLEESYESFKE